MQQPRSPPQRSRRIRWPQSWDRWGQSWCSFGTKSCARSGPHRSSWRPPCQSYPWLVVKASEYAGNVWKKKLRAYILVNKKRRVLIATGPVRLLGADAVSGLTDGALGVTRKVGCESTDAKSILILRWIHFLHTYQMWGWRCCKWASCLNWWVT